MRRPCSKNILMPLNWGILEKMFIKLRFEYNKLTFDGIYAVFSLFQLLRDPESQFSGEKSLHYWNIRCIHYSGLQFVDFQNYTSFKRYLMALFQFLASDQ